MCNPVYKVYACGHESYRGVKECGYNRRHGRCFYEDQAMAITERSSRICNSCAALAALRGFQYARSRR